MATQLASRGEGLKAGQIVMTGSVMKTDFPEDAASYRFDRDRAEYWFGRRCRFGR